MTSITWRKLDRTSGCLTSHTCRNTQRYRHSDRYARTYMRIDSTSTFTTNSHSFLLCLFIFLITNSATGAVEQEKRCYKIKLRCAINSPHQFDYSQGATSCRLSFEKSRDEASNSKANLLIIDEPDNWQLYAIKPFSAKIAPNPANVSLILPAQTANS